MIKYADLHSIHPALVPDDPSNHSRNPERTRTFPLKTPTISRRQAFSADRYRVIGHAVGLRIRRSGVEALSPAKTFSKVPVSLGFQVVWCMRGKQSAYRKGFRFPTPSPPGDFAKRPIDSPTFFSDAGAML